MTCATCDLHSARALVVRDYLEYKPESGRSALYPQGTLPESLKRALFEASHRETLKHMRRLPLWAWLVVLCGLAAIGAGALLDSGSYLQAVSVELGAAALLLVPIILAERSLVDALAKRADEAAAIQRTEQFLQLDELWKDFGQALEAKKPPDINPERLGRMLDADGWSGTKTIESYAFWTKNGRLLAVPLDLKPLPRGMVRGVMRTAGWSPDRLVDLWRVAASEQ
jgi:hypothetical protein